MKITRPIAYLLTSILCGSTLAACGRTDARTAAAVLANAVTPAARVAQPAPAVPANAVTPAASVASPAPVVSAPQTIAQAGRIVNRGAIQFAAGATTASVSNFVDPSSTDRYTFDASAGQRSSISINSQTGQVLLTLISPDGVPLLRSQSGGTSWSGTLPTSGVYTVEVVNFYIGSQYTVNLNVQPASASGVQILDQGEIDFPPGATSTTMYGTLAPQNIDRYTFDASAGQPASLKVNSPTDQVLLTLVAPNGNPLVRYQSGASSWSGRLPASGSYRVDVVNQAGASPYNLEVSITP